MEGNIDKKIVEPAGYPFGGGKFFDREIEQALPTIMETFQAQAALWNRLCEIEAANRTAYRAVVASATDEVKYAQAAADAAIRRHAAILALPKRDRAPGQLAEAAADNAAKKAIAKAERAKAAAKSKPALDAIELERRVAVKAAVENSGLWWGNFEPILERYDVARVRAMKTNSALWPTRERSFGVIRVRWRSGLPTHVLLNGGDSLASLDVIDQNKHRVQCALTICIKGRGREKEYAKVPIVLSRLPADGGMIRSVSLFRVRTGGEFRWRGAIVAVRPSEAGETKQDGTTLRIERPFLTDDDAFTEAIKHVSWLQSVLDRKAAAKIAEIDDVSDTDTGRLRAVSDLAGGKMTYALIRRLAPVSQKVRDFLKQTHRMESERHHLRAKALRRRKDRYRLMAKHLAAVHARIAAEKPMMAFVRKTPDRPAWGEFLQILGHACKRSGCELTFFKPEKAKIDAAQGITDIPAS